MEKGSCFVLKKFFFVLLFSTVVFAQNPPLPASYEVVTLNNTAAGIGFTSTTLTVNGQQMRTCSGTLETAAIRFRIDGLAAPTAANGTPLSVGQFIQIDGFISLTKFRGIRQTGTSGVIRFTCSR